MVTGGLNTRKRKLEEMFEKIEDCVSMYSIIIIIIVAIYSSASIYNFV